MPAIYLFLETGQIENFQDENKNNLIINTEFRRRGLTQNPREISFCFYFVRLSKWEQGARKEGLEGNMT